MSRWRGIGLALIVLFAGVMSGCTPADRPGIEVSDGGEISAVNCGTWIRRVSVSDAASGRPVWEAYARVTDSGVAGVSRVSLGDLPGTTWVQEADLELEPRPERWRFVVRGGVTTEIVVLDEEFDPGWVYVEGGRRVSPSAYEREVCAQLPRLGRAFVLLFVGGVGLSAGLIVAALLVRRGRRSAAQQDVHAAPGWYTDPSNPAGLRWWDGRRWGTHVFASADHPRR